MCSRRPEYNKKVIMMQAMAPAVYASETEEHPYIRAINLYFRVSTEYLIVMQVLILINCHFYNK